MAAREPLRVLLIEDSARIRLSLSEALAASGRLQVSAFAETAADALRLLDEASFDAVIVDLQLRHGSGMEVLEYLRRPSIGGAVFVVVLTNHALPEYRRRCLQLGARHFFDKSLEFDRVIAVLHDSAESCSADYEANIRPSLPRM
jgi:DNA-binding NarL/FixJ family response regulator